jgi:hypothetical protein
MHVRWFNEVEGRWKSARHKGVKYTRKGIKEQAKGNCTAALDDFQHELAAFSVDLTTRGPLVDAILSSKYQGMLYSQQEDVRLARGRIAEVGGCAQQQSLAFNRVHVSAAEPTPHAPPRNFQVEPQTNGVNSCYRADPARASCFELRNNSERRVRLYVDGLPGVQCTIEPHSYCSLPMAIGHLHLRMMADDEHGTGPAVEADANVTNEGTRLTLGPRQ